MYIFSPSDFALRRLRAGDYRGCLVKAVAGEASGPARSRDSGLHRNLLAQRLEVPGAHLPALRMGQRNHPGQPAGRRNGQESSGAKCSTDSSTLRSTTCWVWIRIAKSRSTSCLWDGFPEPAPEFTDRIPALALETLPYSRHEVDYPAMREMHAASSLAYSRGSRRVAQRGVIHCGSAAAGGRADRPAHCRGNRAA